MPISSLALYAPESMNHRLATLVTLRRVVCGCAGEAVGGVRQWAGCRRNSQPKIACAMKTAGGGARVLVLRDELEVVVADAVNVERAALGEGVRQRHDRLDLVLARAEHGLRIVVAKHHRLQGEHTFRGRGGG